MLLMYCLVDQNQRQNVFLLTAKIKISWCLATTGGRNTPINAQGIEGLAIFSSNSLNSIEILSIQHSQGKECAVGWLLAPTKISHECVRSPARNERRWKGKVQRNRIDPVTFLAYPTNHGKGFNLFVQIHCPLLVSLFVVDYQFAISISNRLIWGWFCWLADWLIDWLTDWLTGWLIDWLIARLIVWSFDWSFCLDI